MSPPVVDRRRRHRTPLPPDQPARRHHRRHRARRLRHPRRPLHERRALLVRPKRLRFKTESAEYAFGNIGDETARTLANAIRDARE